MNRRAGGRAGNGRTTDSGSTSQAREHSTHTDNNDPPSIKTRPITKQTDAPTHAHNKHHARPHARVHAHHFVKKVGRGHSVAGTVGVGFHALLPRSCVVVVVVVVLVVVVVVAADAVAAGDGVAGVAIAATTGATLVVIAATAATATTTTSTTTSPVAVAVAAADASVVAFASITPALQCGVSGCCSRG